MARGRAPVSPVTDRSPESTGPGPGHGLRWRRGRRYDAARGWGQRPRPSRISRLVHRLTSSPGNVGGAPIPRKMKMRQRPAVQAASLARPGRALHPTSVFESCETPKRLAGVISTHPPPPVLQRRELRHREVEDSAIRCWARLQGVYKLDPVSVCTLPKGFANAALPSRGEGAHP